MLRQWMRVQYMGVDLTCHSLLMQVDDHKNQASWQRLIANYGVRGEKLRYTGKAHGWFVRSIENSATR